LPDASIILFPHSYLTLPDLKRLRAYFELLIICQPWFMEPPLQGTDKRDDFSIKMVNPPADLKPPGDFKSLLSEYKLWARQNQDKGYTASLGATQLAAFPEDAPWEIRQMIRRIGRHPLAPAEGRALKWHLILHLAREIEENRVEAEEMLRQLKQRKSPLEEALGEEAPSPGIFNDLPQSGTYPSSDEHRLRLILEAWLGLFRKYVPDDGLLVTLDPQVMSYVMEIFDIQTFSLSAKAEKPSASRPPSGSTETGLKYVQLPSDDGTAHADPLTAGLSGKTIFLVEGQIYPGA
jgi:hypothetical protein